MAPTARGWHCPLFVLCLAFAGTPPMALAWGALGHEVAGQIARDDLDARARARVHALLGDESLAEASTWADRMRSDPDPFWQTQAGPWHYVTVPRGRRYSEVGAPPEGDAVTALARFRRDLCDGDAPPARQQLALRFALHIIQDLHQPLHVGNGRDRGGTTIRVDVDGESETFHWVWDSIVPGSAGTDRQAFLAAIADDGSLRPVAAGDDDPLTWIAESAALRERLYPPPARSDARYLARWLPVARERIALAGIRSAAWLNTTFAACAAAPVSPERAR